MKPISVDCTYRLHPSSGADWNGALFMNDRALLRGIPAWRAGFYSDLFDRGVISALCDRRLLIDSEVASTSLGNYPMVVEHRPVRFVSYPVEWSMGMLKDAALLIIDLELQLCTWNVSNHDAHPWNVVYDASVPYFVDLGAIMELDNVMIWPVPREFPLWPAFGQFAETVLYPLLLMSAGWSRLARGAMVDYRGICSREATALLNAADTERPIQDGGSWMRHLLRRGWRRLRKETTQTSSQSPALPQSAADNLRALLSLSFQGPVSLANRLGVLRDVRRIVEHIQLPKRHQGASGYIGGAVDRTKYYEAFHAGTVPSVTSTDGWTVKNHTLEAILRDMSPTSVLDLGSSTGWYAQLAQSMGAKVVAADVDESCVEVIYQTSRHLRQDILPVLLDFRSPTPGVGPCNEWLRPALDRFRCDMVLASALVHHLVFKQYLTFSQIAVTLRRFAVRSAAVEFVLPEDEWVRDLMTPAFQWYTLKNFLDALGEHFSTITIFPSFPATRRIILCKV